MQSPRVQSPHGRLGERRLLARSPSSLSPGSYACSHCLTHPQLHPGITAVPGIISVAMPQPKFGTHLVQTSAAGSSSQALDRSPCFLGPTVARPPHSVPDSVPLTPAPLRLGRNSRSWHPPQTSNESILWLKQTLTGLFVFPEALFLLQSLPSSRSATLLSLPRPLALRSPLAGMLFTLSH